jgi:hypothetical protein
MMPQIKFTHNWNNKLGCDFFTTIRRWTPSKWKYYMTAEGKIFDIVLNKVKFGQAKLVGVSYYEQLHEIDPTIKILDTGTAKYYEEVFKNFGLDRKSKVILLLFAKVK